MTHQEIFTKVWNHFVVEKNPISSTAGLCMYRGPNGAKCAFGLFIPDELYTTAMEGKGARITLSLYPTLSDHLGHPDADTIHLYAELQSAHDALRGGFAPNSLAIGVDGGLRAFTENIEISLRGLAVKYEFSIGE